MANAGRRVTIPPSAQHINPASQRLAAIATQLEQLVEHSKI
jgi:hypothetical protein